MIRLVLVHGWGLDATMWDPLCTLLPAWSIERVDHGYWGQPSPPARAIAGQEAVAVGHSLGFLWLLLHHPGPWRALVAVNGFTRFARTPHLPQGVPPRFLDHMRRQLAADARGCVVSFLERCGRSEAWQPPGFPAAQPLDEGLRLLRDGDGRAAFAASPGPCLVLAGERDEIATPALTRACFEGSSRVRLAEHAEGDHLLPLSAPAWCADHIRRFVHATLVNSSPGAPP